MYRIESDEVTSSLICVVEPLSWSFANLKSQFKPNIEISDKTLVLVCLTAELVHTGSLNFFYLGTEPFAAS